MFGQNLPIYYLDILTNGKEVEVVKAFLPLYLSLFLGTFFLYYLLIRVSKSKKGILKKFLIVSSGKSVTNAILLGGLPLSICVITGSLLILFDNNQLLDIKGYQSSIILSMCVSSLFIVIYGYLDDKYELRPIVKLVMQFLAVTTFSILTSNYLSSDFTHIAFCIQFFIGMALVNGTNLLDGLDTLTIKVSTAGFAGFFILASLYHVSLISVLSVIFTIPLFSFYLYNKEPAKIHLGEIGSSFIGFIYFSMATLFFATLKDSNTVNSSEIFFIATIPTILPITELTVSFFRRIYNRKSPFSGDRLHIHQILRNFHNISPSNVSSIIGGLYFLSMFFCIVISSYFKLHTSIAFFALVSSVLFSNILIGRKHWKGPDSINLNAKTIFQSLRKNDVNFIETSKINDFEFHIDLNQNEDDNTIDRKRDLKEKSKSAA